jgi:ElaB/YqjD/DUF883 family membrane-anchored ribosome-binding protein
MSELTTEEIAARARAVAGKLGDHLTERTHVLLDGASTVRYNSEDFIRNNPWPAVGVAAGVGFLLGVIIARR